MQNKFRIGEKWKTCQINKKLGKNRKKVKEKGTGKKHEISKELEKNEKHVKKNWGKIK